MARSRPDRVARLLDKAGIKERAATNNPNKAEPGKKAKDRAEDKATKAAEAAEAAQLLLLPLRWLKEAAPQVVEEAAAEAPAAEEAAPAEAPAEEAAGEAQAEG